MILINVLTAKWKESETVETSTRRQTSERTSDTRTNRHSIRWGPGNWHSSGPSYTGKECLSGAYINRQGWCVLTSLIPGLHPRFESGNETTTKREQACDAHVILTHVTGYSVVLSSIKLVLFSNPARFSVFPRGVKGHCIPRKVWVRD